MTDLKTDALEDYNPFGDPLASRKVPDDRQPALLPSADTSSPPPYSIDPGLKDGTLQESNDTFMNTGPPILTVADLQRRQKELDERAAQLDLREKQTQQQEAWRLEHGYGTSEIPNWPPLPRWCCFKPCVRIDFNSDIPSNCRWMAQFAHYFWFAYCCLLCLNVFGTLANMIVSSNPTEAGPLFAVSIVVFLVVPPASFFCWNRPLYKALKKNSSMQFCIFFPFFGAQIIVIFIQLLGINYLGACGWINSLAVFSHSKGVGTFMLFIAALYSAAAGVTAYLIFKVHRFYRGSGASLHHAKQELAQDVVAGSFAAVS